MAQSQVLLPPPAHGCSSEGVSPAADPHIRLHVPVVNPWQPLRDVVSGEGKPLNGSCHQVSPKTQGSSADCLSVTPAKDNVSPLAPLSHG
jgi:hypothetical protein